MAFGLSVGAGLCVSLLMLTHTVYGKVKTCTNTERSVSSL